MTAENEYMDVFGPIDFLVVEFAGGTVGVDGFTRLLALVDQQAIRVLDLEFIAKDDDGSTARIEAHELEAAEGLDLAMLEGASSGILTPGDYSEIGENMTPGMEHNLVDEYRVMIFPVVVGSGFRLFPETPNKTVLKLVTTRNFDSGVVEHTYHPAG